MTGLVKISEQPVNVALGVREASERKELAAQAEAVRVAQARARAFELANEYHWATSGHCSSPADCPGVNECAYAEGGPRTTLLLRLIEADPRRFLAGLPEPEPPARRVKVRQTTGMIHTILESMALHALAIESLARMLPEGEREAHRDAIYHAVEALELLGRPKSD